MVASYMEHPSKASRYESGAYIVYPPALEEDTTVWFAFDAVRELWEGVLAIREAEDRARLVGVPLWTYGVNLDDVVELIESGEGAPVAVGAVGRSSNRTFRVVYPDLKPGDDDDRWRQLLIDMEPWDCWFDVLGPGYLAISAPEATAEAVERYLKQRANAGDFIYERGYVE
jgi:hypothetical protein